MKIRLAPIFYHLSAVCCLYYIVAQLIQEISFHIGINDSATGEAGILQRVMWLDQLRLVLILLGFSFIPVITAFAAVALRRFQVRPAASLLGFGFSLFFVGSEASVRSIDFFLVSRTWAGQYQTAVSETVKQAIATRIQVWDDAIAAFYFALLGAHLLSSACFGVALWEKNSGARWVSAGFLLSAIESASRIAEGYLKQSWLAGPNGVAYFPVVLVSFGTLAAWLWRQAREIQRENAVM